MLDIKFIRENQELVKEAARKKHIEFNLDELIALDDERRAATGRVEAARAEQNKASQEIAATRDLSQRARIIEQMQELKTKMQSEEAALQETMKKWKLLMLQVPNIPDVSVPEGAGEEDNVEVKVWGEKPQFSFTPKDHVELMLALRMVDFERGIKAHGFRGYFLVNDGAALSWAIWNYARDFYKKDGWTEIITPAIVRREHFYGTGHLPKEAEDLFETQDHDHLSGTAEVPMMAYHGDEILELKDLPKKYLAFSPCYRREAGAHSKDVKGLIRVHEFYKFEQLVICKADHEESARIHEELTERLEQFLETLELPYRRTLVCGGDLSASKVKQYELELWVPLQQTYREIGSSSYYHDYQTRRFGTRYRDENGVLRYVHSLNNTAIPTPRILVSLVENHQQADGSVRIPKALVPYIGKDVIR